MIGRSGIAGGESKESRLEAAPTEKMRSDFELWESAAADRDRYYQ